METTGVTDIEQKLDLKLDDQDILLTLKRKIADAESAMKERNIPERRAKMHRYWKGDFDLWAMYDYEEKNTYKENRVYMYVEHLIESVNNNVAQAEAVARKKTYQARQLAVQFRDFLMSWMEQHGAKDLFRSATRDNQLDFLGAIKIEWDETAGPIGENGKPLGDVKMYVVKPGNLIIDKHASPDHEPSFIVEIREDTLDEVIRKFPKKKNHILEKLGIRGVKTQMGATIKYYEVHFTYYQGNKAKEAVAWVSPDLGMVFDKQKHQAWDEEGEMVSGEKVFKNLLSKPFKPYAFIYNRDSSHSLIDETNAIEQALPLQDVIARRGFQIQQAADDNRGGWVFSAESISDEDAAKFTNNPEDHLRLKGDIRAGVDRKPPHLLPEFIHRSMEDARAQMDNIVGIHSVSRGERMGDDQPTTLQILREGDFARQGGLVAGIDRAAEFVYQYVAHFFKLKYTEEHYVIKAGEDGRSVFLKYNRDTLKDGLEIYVKAGTTLPTDKVSQREEAMRLMELGKIDYETFFDRLGFPNPKEMAQTLYLHETNPAHLYAAGNAAEEADEDVELLKEGRKPQSPDEISDVYIAALMQFMQSEEFQNMSPDNQTIARDYLSEIVQKGRARAQNPQPALAVPGNVPTPQQPAAPETTPVAQQRLPQVA